MTSPCAQGRVATAVVTAALLTVGGWLLRPSTPQPPAPAADRDCCVTTTQRSSTATRSEPSSRDGPALGPRDSAVPDTDLLDLPALRLTLEAWLADADTWHDSPRLKDALARQMARHVPAALAVRALALAERYVDYRVALAQWQAPPPGTDPQQLRAALQARQILRQRFFADDEYQALFGSEDALDRYTLARLEILRDPQRTPAQRHQALESTALLLRPERLAERQRATQHLAAAAQTAAFNAQHIDRTQRYAVRKAAYGDAAAQALAALDQQEQDWQQRLDLYRRARQGERLAQEQLRPQPFTAQELQRVEGALALRALEHTAAPSPEPPCPPQPFNPGSCP